MRVIGLGLPRTGTTSLARLLTELGFKTTHHEPNWIDGVIPNNPKHEQDLAAVVYGPPLYLDAFLRIPAKFIVTTRDRESWLTSIQRFHVHRSGDKENPKRLKKDTFFHVLHHMLMFGTCNPTLEDFNKAYDEHQEWLRSAKEKEGENLLVLDVRNCTRTTVCNFLGKPIQNEPFPHYNHGTVDKLPVHQTDPPDVKIPKILHNFERFLEVIHCTPSDICLVGSLVLYLHGLIDTLGDLDYIRSKTCKKKFVQHYSNVLLVGKMPGFSQPVCHIRFKYKDKEYKDADIVHNETFHTQYRNFKVIALETQIAGWIALVEQEQAPAHKYCIKWLEWIRLIIDSDSAEAQTAISKLNDYGFPNTPDTLARYIQEIGVI